MLATEKDRWFVVYSVDGPTYPDWMFGLSPAKRESHIVHGSVVLMGAGCRCDQSDDMSSARDVLPVRLIQDLDTVGTQFSALAVQALLQPDERVVIQRSGRHLVSAKWLQSAHRAGFEVIATPQDAVCIGDSQLLPRLPWLEGVEDWDDVHLIASAQHESELEGTLIQGAKRGADVRKIVSSFFHRVYTEPAVAMRELDGYDLIAGVVGLQGEYFWIGRASSDLRALESALPGIAVQLGVALFFAGGVSGPAARADPFGMLRGERNLWRRWVRVA